MNSNPAAQAIMEEMLERDWNLSRVVIESGLAGEEAQKFMLALQMFLVVDDPNLLMDAWSARCLATAFGVSGEFFLNLSRCEPIATREREEAILQACAEIAFEMQREQGTSAIGSAIQFRMSRPDASRLLELRELRARMREREAVSEYLEHAYSKDVFRPLAQEEINCLAGVMGETIDGGSDRMHAEWARHWARCFRMCAADLKRQIDERAATEPRKV